MAGGLINIVSYGSKDLYLTGSPQITFFKLVYRRHTNFSMESINIDFEERIEFNHESELIVPPIGDGIHKGYLQLTLPEIDFRRSDVGVSVSNSVSVEDRLNNYNKVIDFMGLNTKAYRAAYENIYAENVTTLNVIEAALEQFQDAPLDSGFGISTVKGTIIDNYRTLINTTDGLEYNSSSLYFILGELKDAIVSNGETIEKEYLMEVLNNAMKISIKVQNYFFKESLEQRDEVNDTISKNIKFAWVKRLGHVIIDYIDVYIGGEKIDRHYGLWLDIWYELTGNTHQNKLYSKMIGDVPELTTFDRNVKPEYKLYIPLNFWFNRHNGSTIPLIALQYSDLSFVVKLKKFSQCAYVERIKNDHGNDVYIAMDDLWEDKGYDINGSMLLDYVFMERSERRKFAQSAHEYLVETIQYNLNKDISTQRVQVKLDFRHPCKEVIWVAQKDAYINNEVGFRKTYHTTYSTSITDDSNPFITSSMSFNGYSRVDKFDGSYFNYFQTMKHRNTPANGINIYSFGFNPEALQPSGSCNFSKIPNTIMNFIMNPDIFTYKLSDIIPGIVPGSADDATSTCTIKIHIFAVSYNILRIIGGFGGMAYS